MRTLKKIAVVLVCILLGYVGGAVVGWAVDIFLLPDESLTSTAYGAIDLVGMIIGLILGIRRVRRWPDEQTARPNLVPNFTYGELPTADSPASLSTKEAIAPFCGQCGAPVSERSKFCVSCGERLEAPPSSISTTSPSATSVGVASSGSGAAIRTLASAPEQSSPLDEDGLKLGRIFSTKGRVGRKDYWIVFLLLVIVWIGVFTVYSEVLYEGVCPSGSNSDQRFPTENCVPDEEAQGVASLIFLILLIPMFFMSVKRAHDVDRTGLRMVVYSFIPLLGLGQVIQLLFDKGDLRYTENRFGVRNSGSPFPRLHRSSS